MLENPFTPSKLAAKKKKNRTIKVAREKRLSTRKEEKREIFPGDGTR
jgi:hypothetical protein